MDKIEFNKEKENLSKTLNIVKELLVREQNDLKRLYKEFIGNREELWRLADMKKVHISNLEASQDNPYFARIDFTSYEDGKTNTIYIGKNGIMNNSDIVVTDWRAPISSLYYDAEIGKCSFEAPMGTIEGIMNLKRQYEIEKGNLLEYFDVDLVSNDALLQKYLNTNNDARLKSIVSTIQKEQNDVIRRKLNENLIIQGVAGSGKTTVALHRIAYLVYNHIKNIDQSQYLVVGPNPVFLKYIKSVLPELDVSGVKQFTFEQFVKEYINDDININSSDKKVIANISGKNNSDIDKFKCSIKYKNMIDKFLKIYFYSITSKPLMLGKFEVLPKEIITKVFQDTNNTYSNNLNSRIEMTIDRLCRLIEDNINSINSRYSDYSFDLFQTAKSEDEKNSMRSKFSKDRAELSKNCRGLIRKYFSKTKITPIKLYKLFLNQINDFDLYNFNELETLKKETLKNIKLNAFDFEDLSALIYIQSMISPIKEFEKIKHVVIDEAQDFGEFNFYVFKKVLPSATFSIFGDLAQSIYDYRSINNWQEVNNVMFNNQAKIINFNKSYRTTAEIMDVADDVAESIGLTRSDLVVRHGNSVNLTEIKEDSNIPEYIAKKILEYKEKGYKTIAVVSKTNLLSNYVNDDLVDLGIHIPNISANDDLNDEKFRICTISNQLAKGLEFDAVIINNANENIYSSDSNLDMKLLYVAITRALHELDIVYSGELTKPLAKHLQKKFI